MYTGIHKPNSIHGGNKGSCSNLVEYLSKENNYKENTQYFSFDGEFSKEEVINDIDKMGVGLKQNEAKFFMLSINPSVKEQEHILFKITGEKGLQLNAVSPEVKVKYEQELQKYTHQVMNNYAQNFNRVVNGKQLKGNDLVYYARIEYTRKYDEKSIEVLENRIIRKEIKSLNPSKDKEKINELQAKFHRNSERKIIIDGMQKEGNNSHVHIIVSRYDREKQTSLSQHSNSKQQNNSFGKDIKQGFDRTEFIEMNEKSFDNTFEYSREKSETFEYKNEQSKAHLQHSKLKVLSKEGQVNGVKVLEATAELVKFTAKMGFTIATGGTSALKIEPQKIGQKILDIATNEVKQEIKKLSPMEQLQNRLNPKKVAIQTLKKELGKGGMEAEM